MIETLQEWLSNPLLTRWEGGPWQATLVTLYMTAVTMVLTVLLGLPLGVALSTRSSASWSTCCAPSPSSSSSSR
jgi:ABC-type proline/glycine betaine transport system permease subunit